MFPIGFVVPAVVVLAVGLYVVLREARAAVARVGVTGPGPVITAVGEALLIVGALAVFLQGRVVGLVLAPAAGFGVFFGGAVCFFGGMALEGSRTARP